MWWLKACCLPLHASSGSSPNSKSEVPESAADAAKRVQREVLREGWHLRADRGVNILCYERKRSDRGSSRINGIVICEPQRFIQALPAIDSTLVRVVEGASVPT
jgi:hypothetical protein